MKDIGKKRKITNAMDREKLTEARSKFIRDNRTLIGNNGPLIADAFDECADWLMQQPLSERLTEEEKEKIKAIYFRNVYSAADVQSNFTEKCLIDAIFGEDLFKEK